MESNSRQPSPQRAGTRLILLAILLSILFWFLEAVLHVLIWTEADLYVELFTPPLHEIWMRLTIMSLFITFGVYASHLIKARLRAEEKTLQANYELSQIFNTAADGMRVVDRDFNVLNANATFGRMLGMDKEEIIGRKCYELFSGPRCHTPDCPLTLVQNDAERVEYDAEKLPPSGASLPCIVTATPFRRPNGELIGIVEDFKDISERIQAEQEVMESRQQLRELTNHLQLVREEERNRIEREIHDELGQALTALNMDVYWLRKHIDKANLPLVEKTRAMSELINQTVQSVRRICLELRPWLLSDFGLSAAIEWQAKEFGKRTGIHCTIASQPEDIVLPQNLSIAIFRIFQETLTNIIRHAEASQVEISLLQDHDHFAMDVTDDGKGIGEEQMHKPHSFGLIGIQERVREFAGEVSISSGKQGTNISVKIPLAAEQESKATA
jgi:PAS domain S-box-containing protein